MRRNRRDGVRFRSLVSITAAALAAGALNRPTVATAATLPSQILRHLNAYYRETNPIRVSGSEIRALQTYLAKGPTFWASNPAPKFPQGLILSYPNGALRATPVTEFFAWQRAQNPILFDWRHPRIAPLFQQYTATTSQALAHNLATTIQKSVRGTGLQTLNSTAAATATASPTTGTGASSRIPVDPIPPPLPAPVPEPASVASALLLFTAAGWWWQARRRRA
jgi:hypothetical protein